MPERPSELLSLDIRCDRNAPAVVRGVLAEVDDDGLSLGDAILVASELVTQRCLTLGRLGGSHGQGTGESAGRSSVDLGA
jgi:hypothetical protein